jgi:hypothetical protein
MGDGVKRESSLSPARSETPSTRRSFIRGTWEIPPQSSCERRDLSGKATGNEPDGNRSGKSDDDVLPKKQPNAAQAAEAVEGRPSTKRNTVRAAAVRTQSRVAASCGARQSATIVVNAISVVARLVAHSLPPQSAPHVVGPLLFTCSDVVARTPSAPSLSRRAFSRHTLKVGAVCVMWPILRCGAQVVSPCCCNELVGSNAT